MLCNNNLGRAIDSYAATYIASHGIIRYTNKKDEVGRFAGGGYPEMNHLNIVSITQIHHINTGGLLKTVLKFLLSIFNNRTIIPSSIYTLPAPSTGRINLKIKGHRMMYPKKNVLINLIITCLLTWTQCSWAV